MGALGWTNRTIKGFAKGGFAWPATIWISQPQIHFRAGLHPALEQRFAERNLGHAGGRFSHPPLALPEDARTTQKHPTMKSMKIRRFLQGCSMQLHLRPKCPHKEPPLFWLWHHLKPPSTPRKTLPFFIISLYKKSPAKLSRKQYLQPKSLPIFTDPRRW